MISDKRIPVSIITGFLGAGKTTFLNEIIRTYPQKRIAIIENEFGEQGIDNELVIKGDESLFAMSAGCICCDLNTELVETLQKIAEDPSRMDHLIIETTGIADPGAVIRPFLEDLLTRSAFRLDGVLCVVDARHLDQQLARDKESIRQIALANSLLLNKSENIAPAEIQRLIQVLNKLNADAEIQVSQFGKFSHNPLELMAWDLFHAGQKWDGITVHHHHHHHIVSHSFVLKADFDLAKFDLWMKQILQIQGDSIYRAKGILSIPKVDRKLVFQSVHKDYVAGFTEEWRDSPRISKLVFLGKELRRDILEKRINTCLVDPKTPNYGLF